MVYFGDIPTGFTVLSSCDSAYLKDHAPAFITSCVLAKNNVHLHIINPSKTDLAFAQGLRIYANTISSTRITLSSEEQNLDGFDSESIRTYYACNRFLIANYLLQMSNLSLFITDIDCVFMKHIDEPDADIGLFLREPLPGTNSWETEGSRVAAGCVYYNSNMTIFAQEVTNIIHNHDMKWFVDQLALNTVYQKHKNNLKLYRYKSNFMDWEFLPDTSIWTGKGNRKYENKTYLNKKDDFSNMLKNAKDNFWISK